MSPKDCAYIVERLAISFMALVADHERQLTGDRAAFGARTEADRQIIEKLRAIVKEQSDHAKDAGTLLGWAPNESAFQAAQRVVKERDGLRAEVAALQERLRASIARGDFAQMEVAALKSQTPKQSHPVAVGGYLRRLTGFNTTPAGEIARVTLVDADDPSRVEYEVMRPNGQKGRWSAKSCEPCDPPATIKREPTIGDTVRLVTHPERAKVAEHLQLALQWPWIDRWGVVGQTGKVVKPLVAVAEAVAVALDGSTIFARWPIDCLEVVAEATHDTEAGKAAADQTL